MTRSDNSRVASRGPTTPVTRRGMLKSGAAVAGPLTLGLSASLPRVSAQSARLPDGAVRFQPQIEPLVQLLENTERDKLFAAVAEKIRQGVSYRQWVAATFLAAIRNVEPRPSVGYQFHSVLVVNSAHLASLAARDQERWLPLFWAMDYFKRCQARDSRQGNWTMAAVSEDRLPSADTAVAKLRAAMEQWDVEAADHAAAAAARSAPAHVLFDLFSEFGARDFRSIGHKSIYVAGAFRVLGVIGWHYAEPVMRGLAYALLNHTGDPNPAKSDLEVDRAGRANWKLAKSWRRDWLAGRTDDAATVSLVEAARQASPLELSTATADIIAEQIDPRSVYDGLYASAAELVMRQPAIVPLHAMTTTNAIHYLYQHVSSDPLRRWLMLQNAAFLAHFRDAAEGRQRLADRKITDIHAGEASPSLPEVFAAVGTRTDGQANQVYAYLRNGGNAQSFLRQARQLVFEKGDDAHDYKYSSALLEDYYPRTPAWRDRILSAGSYLLAGSGNNDTNLPEKVRDAFAS